MVPLPLPLPPLLLTVAPVRGEKADSRLVWAWEEVVLLPRLGMVAAPYPW